ncbi:MAG TPA: helix-turn-helix transcriptional regulator [bacterium]|jgi:transcriptional regulator with XRE-family HTH domain|nr:helix-turn-helix transcriptional regulator [bacterium]
MTTFQTELFKAANARISKNVHRLVKKQGWTIEKLAFDSDLDKGNTYNMVNGKINFTLRAVWKMSQTLQVDLSEFFKP